MNSGYKEKHNVTSTLIGQNHIVPPVYYVRLAVERTYYCSAGRHHWARVDEGIRKSAELSLSGKARNIAERGRRAYYCVTPDLKYDYKEGERARGAKLKTKMANKN